MPLGRVLVVLFLAATVARAAELRTLDGKTVTGDLVKVTDKEVVLRADGKEVATPIEAVLQVDLKEPIRKPAGATYFLVELTDGSQLHCGGVAFKDKDATLTLLSGQEVKLPLAGVAWVLSDAQDEKNRQWWKEVRSKKRSSDVLAVRDKEGVLQTLGGTFGDADAEGKKIAFDLDSQGNPRSLALDRIHALAFLRQQDPMAPPKVCKILDTGDNVVFASAVEVRGNGFTVTTPAGAKIEYAPNLVAQFDFSRDKLFWLSDVEPVKVVETSALDRVEHYRRNRNLDGGTLRLGNVAYAKGLALHAHTELEYQLDGEYREFKAVVGIDDMVGGSDGQTQLRIEGDGRELLAIAVSRKDKPRPITLNVKDVQKLKIIVSSGDLLDLGKHLDLADAKVSK